MADDKSGGITLEQLEKKHPDRALWEGRWPDYRLAYKGGEMFLRAAGMNTAARTNTNSMATAFGSGSPFNVPSRRFLRQLEGEPNDVYNQVWEKAYYINWMSSIIDYFRHWLFTQPPSIHPAATDAGDVADSPDWWVDFFNDCNGAGSTLVDFIRDEFLDVLLLRRSGWLIGGMTSVGQGGNGEVGGDMKPVLTHFKAEDIYDWQTTATGELEWVLLHKKDLRREFPNERMEIETFTFVDQNTYTTWEVEKDGKQVTVVKIAEDVHALGEVPFVLMEIPHGLWIADKLFSWQVSLFNKMNRLDNATLLSCIAQPFIRSNDPNAGDRILGEGYMLKLRAGGEAIGESPEEFGWMSPQIGALDFIATQIKDQRDEGYRIVHQMSLAVDSSSIGAIARSGTSKIEDRKAAEVVLAAYGGHVRDAMIRTANLVSKVQGDNNTWVCDGFDNFQVSSLDEEMQIAALAATLDIKSATFKKKLQVKTANRILDREDEKTKETIAKEISDGIDAEGEAALGVAGSQPPVIPPPVEDPGAADVPSPPPTDS